MAQNQALSSCSTGLVYSSTSQNTLGLIPQSPITELVDPMLYRLKKLKHSVITSARLIQNQNKKSFRYKPAMVTLTYSPNQQWKAKDIAQFLDHVRKYFRRNFKNYTFQYTWVAELQKRGAVHYHVILWLPFVRRSAMHIPMPDKQGWWSKGSSNIELARNAVGYIAKYASKGHTDDNGNSFPRGTRLYACGGLNNESKREARFWRLPSYIREQFAKYLPLPNMSDLRRIKGGFFNKDTGEFIESEYAFCGLKNGSPIIIKKVLLCA